MDRSFNSPKNRFSPMSRQSMNTSRGIIPSFRKSSRFSTSGRSAQSTQIILSTPFNSVERFGEPLPVLITEALTFADKYTVVSSRISKNGYAWLVCGRRLLIWQYRQSPQPNTAHKKSHLINQCFELQLPQSDLAHRAELVSVMAGNSNTPSCIAVSPEGVVRYWPAIIHEGVSVEQHVSLHGQECDSLVDVDGLGCILVTTTCTVLLIQPQLTSGRYGLKCKTLKAPSGWLGGISKRMSSLIFGPITTEQSTETGPVRVISVFNPPTDNWSIYVLANHTLQKWRVSKSDTENLVYVVELNRMVRDAFRGALWETTGEQTEIVTWLLDIQPDKDNVIVLAAAVNTSAAPRIHYAMVCIHTAGADDSPPTAIKDFLLLKLNNFYHENNAADVLSYRFLLNGVTAFLYNHRSITVIKPQEEADTLEFHPPQDFILAGCICVNTPIFFSRKHSLVSVNGNDNVGDPNLNSTLGNTSMGLEASFSDSAVVNNLSMYNMNPEDFQESCDDTLGQLKAAFIYYVKNQEMAYKEIVNKYFPRDSSRIPGIDSLLDKVVVKICGHILDDIPAGDPRWNKDTATQVGLGSSYSMQVANQLEDKQRAHLLFAKFLKDSGLWHQLSASTIRGTTMATAHTLAEMSEKIVAALTLKNLAIANVTLDKAFEKAVTDGDDYAATNDNILTNQDIFFRLVSRVERGIQELINYCEDVAHSDADPVEIVDVIVETNTFVQGVLKDVLKHRQQYSESFKPSESVIQIAPDYLPWTAANGTEGLSDYLTQLHYLTYNYGILLTQNDRQRYELLDQLVALIDVILDGRKDHLQSIKGTSREEILFKQYCASRTKFMKPLVQQKEWERAAKLAEKYLDFDTLVTICEVTSDERRLDDYLERFDSSGFSEYVCNWFLRENKQAKLLDLCRRGPRSKNVQKLSTFLSDHPSVSWMQQIFDKKYSVAAEILHRLSAEESESVTRQKTMLSVSKLAKLAAPLAEDTDAFVRSVSQKLEVIGLQEEIPDYVLHQYGYDTVNIRVVPPKDLIDLYTCDEYKEAEELEFKKALDLLRFVDDDEVRSDLNLRIWRRALLRDSWRHANMDSPLEILANKLFFRLVDLILAIDGEALSSLPQLKALLDDESTVNLRDDPNCQYLLKTGYEHIYKTQTVE